MIALITHDPIHLGYPKYLKVVDRNKKVPTGKPIFSSDSAYATRKSKGIKFSNPFFPDIFLLSEASSEKCAPINRIIERIIPRTAINFGNKPGPTTSDSKETVILLP